MHTHILLLFYILQFPELPVNNKFYLTILIYAFVIEEVEFDNIIWDLG